MNDQRMVDVEMLRTTMQQVLADAQAQDVLQEWWPMMERAIINGPGVEPVAYICTGKTTGKQQWWKPEDGDVYAAFPSDYFHVTPLYIAAPSAPVAPLGVVRPVAPLSGVSENASSYVPVAPVQAVPDGWQLINRTPTPEQRELLLRADEFTTGEMWIMLLAAAPQPPKESTAQSVACPTDKEK